MAEHLALNQGVGGSNPPGLDFFENNKAIYLNIIIVIVILGELYAFYYSGGKGFAAEA